LEQSLPKKLSISRQKTDITQKSFVLSLSMKTVLSANTTMQEYNFHGHIELNLRIGFSLRIIGRQSALNIEERPKMSAHIERENTISVESFFA